MKHPKPRAQDIIAVCAAAHGVTSKQIKGRRRYQPLATARQEAMFLLRRLRNDTHPNIGRMLGGRDHSTSIFGVRQVNRRIADDPDVAARLSAMVAAVRCPVLRSPFK